MAKEIKEQTAEELEKVIKDVSYSGRYHSARLALVALALKACQQVVQKNATRTYARTAAQKPWLVSNGFCKCLSNLFYSERIIGFVNGSNGIWIF